MKFHGWPAKSLQRYAVDWRYFASMQGLPRKIIMKEGDN